MSALAGVGLALSGLSALQGLFSKPKPAVSDTSSSSTTQPLYDAKSGFFKDYLMNLYGGRLRNNDEFESGYKTNGLFNLQDAARRSHDSVDSILTSRGLGRTGAGGNALADNSYKAGNSIASFLNGLPQIFDQRREQNLNDAGGFFSSLPTGSTTNSTSHTVGQPSGPSAISGLVGGGASGFATYLGQLAANQQLGNILKTMGTASPSGSKQLPMPG